MAIRKNAPPALKRRTVEHLPPRFVSAAFPGPVWLTVHSRAFSIQQTRGPASGHLTFWMERQGATVTANWHLNCFDKHAPLTECPIGVSPGRQLRPDGQTHWK